MPNFLSGFTKSLMCEIVPLIFNGVVIITNVPRIIFNMKWKSILLLGIVLLCCTLAHGDMAVDVREGKDVTLDCRFNNPSIPLAGGKLYWMRQKDVVAIDDTPFDANYRVDLRRDDGRYDLIISRATYDRDNGMFECRVKEGGTGADLHSTTVNLTVLIPPGSPRVTPEIPKVTEGDNIDLICSSRGGSPDPQINWYRKGSTTKLNSVLKPGGGRDTPTTSILTLQPGKDDDEAEYRCVVWNRASEDEKMESIVRLNVEYYPRITIGPANPLKVELASTLSMNCYADAKPPVSNVRWTRAGRFLETKNTFSKMNVEMDDAGRYICLADNGLGVTKEAEITVDVLYGPRVSVITSKDVDEGEDIFISCNVTASPPPITIEWLKLDDDSFRQNGDYLQLDRVTAANQGDYVCRAVNILNPTGGEASERIGNATVAVRVRHAPGKTYIIPAEPIAVQDEATTLTCGSNPPGWPTPTYRWWFGDTDATLTLGANYTIPRASLADEGTYYCQPSNRLGKGTPVSVSVKVYQPPRILEGLAESAVFEIGKTDISLTCRAQGKPLPSIHWLKDEEEIKPADGLYHILVDQASRGSNDVHTLETSLMFQGKERINENQLMPQDRGVYKCVFKNAVRELSSAQQIKVKHSPVTIHKANKVAYDLNDDAFINCRMQSFPPTTFHWYRGSNLLTADNIKYFTNDTTLDEDIYGSVLNIRNIEEDDYDDYICKGTNSMGEHKTIIALKPKGPPESPTNLHVVRMGTDYCELGWEDGFNGGIETFYQVLAIANGIKLDHDCQNNNPCVITELQQQTNYVFNVKAVNTKGESDYSDPREATTLLDVSAIPEPEDVFYEPKGNMLSFRVLENNLELEGFIETRSAGSAVWITIPNPIVLNRRDNSPKEIPLGGERLDNIRVKLCSKASTDVCGNYMSAQRVDILPARASADQAGSYTVIIVVVVVVCLVAIAIVGICCCCRHKNARLKKKHQDMEVTHRGVNSQAPPPPYYTVGLDNKALDGSCDTGLDDPAKAAIYSQQHFNNGALNNYNNNGVGNGYMDNSYSNSNNGGSVNSQDSLWQVKGTAAVEQQINNGGDPRSYQYDPMVHGGYAMPGYDDYSHYPPNNQNHPGHDEYGPRPTYIAANGDPYAAVQKTRNNMDHIDGGYDVSGHPDPYMAHSGHHGPPGDMLPPPDNRPQISFDESLESGYSTPNSRNRRIIREIIV